MDVSHFQVMTGIFCALCICFSIGRDQLAHGTDMHAIIVQFDSGSGRFAPQWPKRGTVHHSSKTDTESTETAGTQTHKHTYQLPNTAYIPPVSIQKVRKTQNIHLFALSTFLSAVCFQSESGWWKNMSLSSRVQQHLPPSSQLTGTGHYENG